MRRAEAGEDPEREVERADEGSGGEAEEASGNAEVGDQPERVGGEVWAQVGDEVIELGLSEAVEEEVGDDEVVGAGGGEAAGVGEVGTPVQGVPLRVNPDGAGLLPLQEPLKPKETPALAAMFPGPFQLGGPHTLEIALAPMTPAVLEKENVVRPSSWRAVTVLTRA